MLTYLFEDVPESGEVYEVAPGILWLRMPLPMDLDHINLYLLEDDDGWWVIDTGIALGPTEELWEGVFERHLKGKPVKAVLATHFHPDHTGMAGWLCERWRAPFYMSQAEYYTGIAFSRTEKEHYSWTSEQNMRRVGFDQETIDAARENHGGFGSIIKPMPTAFRRLVNGMALTISGERWQVVMGSGHSPEHACLYNSARNILISGDQVIPRITSNISVSSSEPEGNPLRDWFQSLEHFLEILPADALVLPAHNAPFHGLHERLRYLIDHHEDHLLALEEACIEQERTALDLVPVLFKRELSGNNLPLAVGECLAHLNYLFQRGQLQRTEDDTGRYTYRSVDTTLPLRLRQRHHEEPSDGPLQV
jgi:glyoxylase-like metal-dependent hydrolase (beta-lactamase superfamily II)